MKSFNNMHPEQRGAHHYPRFLSVCQFSQRRRPARTVPDPDMAIEYVIERSRFPEIPVGATVRIVAGIPPRDGDFVLAFSRSGRTTIARFTRCPCSSCYQQGATVSSLSRVIGVVFEIVAPSTN